MRTLEEIYQNAFYIQGIIIGNIISLNTWWKT